MTRSPNGRDDATEASLRLQPEDVLEDVSEADVLEQGYSPEDRPWAVDDPAVSGEEETLDQRLAEEEPEDDGADEDGDGLGDVTGTDGELRDNMKVDADRYIPFPPSEVVMDFKALRDLPSDPDAPNWRPNLATQKLTNVNLKEGAWVALPVSPAVCWSLWPPLRVMMPSRQIRQPRVEPVRWPARHWVRA